LVFAGTPLGREVPAPCCQSSLLRHTPQIRRLPRTLSCPLLELREIFYVTHPPTSRELALPLFFAKLQRAGSSFFVLPPPCPIVFGSFLDHAMSNLPTPRGPCDRLASHLTARPSRIIGIVSSGPFVRGVDFLVATLQVLTLRLFPLPPDCYGAPFQSQSLGSSAWSSFSLILFSSYVRVLLIR